jgi:DNA invertase Pin-like site-specific DNA recombinase
MKAIGYVRLSQESDTSIDRQKANIQNYANQNGFRLEEIFSDGQHASGFDGDRPAYESVVESVRKGSIDAVIVNDKRRLTRDVDEAMRLIPDFRENGVELHTYQDGSLDLSDPIRAAIEIVSAAAAHEEKMQEIEKAREATRERVENPDVDHGPPRVGMKYDADGRRQVPADDFDKVREIFELRGKGWTLQQIGEETGVAKSTAYRVIEHREWYQKRTDKDLPGSIV